MKYVALCYHYITGLNDDFPRILGVSYDNFVKQLDAIKERYRIIGLSDIEEESDDFGILFTFDDGLAEHLVAAQELQKRNIKGVFFVPNCVASSGLPSNPTLLHHLIAYYGLNEFLDRLGYAAKELRIDLNYYLSGVLQERVRQIKHYLTYELKEPYWTRELLLEMYFVMQDDFFSARYICLKPESIRAILDTGHTIGAHTESHYPVSRLNDWEIDQEVLWSTEEMEAELRIKADAFSYPYGIKKSYEGAHEKIKHYNKFKYIFGSEVGMNNGNEDIIYRLPGHSTDTAESLLEKIERARNE